MVTYLFKLVLINLLFAEDFVEDFGAVAPDVPAPSSLPAWARDLFFPLPLLPDDIFFFYVYDVKSFYLSSVKFTTNFINLLAQTFWNFH